MEGRRLTKSSDNKMICGVCGGVGEYLHIDATLIRLLWALLGIGGLGTGALIYLIAAIIIPADD